MADSRSRTHALHVADSDNGARASAVFVRKRAFEHVGDNFHVAVRVSGEPGAGSDTILIDYSEVAEAHVLSIIVVTERKRMTAVEPGCPRFTSFSCCPDFNHFIHPFISSLKNLLSLTHARRSSE